MKRSTGMMGGLALLSAASLALAEGSNTVSLKGLQLVSPSGIEARLETVTGSDGGPEALQVTFTKPGEERRLLALEVPPRGDLREYRALILRYEVQLCQGQPPRLALVAFDGRSGAWFKVQPYPVAVGKSAEGRLSLASLQRAAFSRDAGEAPAWDRIEKVWLGWVLDGPAEGSFEITQVSFTREPYRPTEPLEITGDGPGRWSVGQDPAVQSTLTTPNEGPGGKPCMKFEFTFPGGRHMYATPFTPVPPVEREGYRALRFTYKATLPEGIGGLLVMLGEQGAQFFADPPPPPSADWTTLTIPFEQFKLGGWSRDDNGQLDLERVDRVFIAVHGTAAGSGGSGTLWATDIQFVP